MKNGLTTVLMLLPWVVIIGQDNCNFFLMEGDTCRYRACQFMAEAPGYFQLTRQYHEIKDSAIALCPEYATPYRHKSTGYLKTGDFITFKKLIDQAVELNPLENLDYRGWCRFQFFRDYQGAIDDIELLDSLANYDIGMCQNGYYHLHVARGLCYKMLGERERAIDIIRAQILEAPEKVGLYDYLHLGVLYLESEQYELAVQYFDRQDDVLTLAENYYYRALAYRAMGDRGGWHKGLEKALELYELNDVMFDIYTHQVDKVYLQQIRDEMAAAGIGG